MISRRLDEEAIFHVARQIDSPLGRSAYLDQICAGDQSLRHRVEALLAVHEREEHFLKPSGEPAATIDQPPITERPGTTIGRYRLMEQIGEGGMGVVFVAEQERPLRRKVALKIIKPGMDSKAVVARFEAERQALALMDHPNIARVLDAGTTESGLPYFVMELVRGIPITDYCDQNKLSIRERLKLFIPVCQAIQHAHQKGIVHRDIKPSNVLITLHDGQPVPKVIDFGVAKALHQRLTERTIYTSFAQAIGTPLYMSPEQAELSGLDIDTRTDVYSLGVLLYELLTGTTPLDRQTLEKAGYDEIRRIIREQEPPKPSTKISSLGETATSVSAHRGTDPRGLSKLVMGDLDVIVMKALEKDRTRRYDTASGFAADVQRFLEDEPIVARPPSLTYRLTKFARRNRVAVMTSTLVLASLVSGVVAASWMAVVASDRAARLEAQKQTIAELYFRQILESVMSGAGEKAALAIREVQSQKEEILPPAKIEYLMGMRCLYGGSPEEADRHFDKAIKDAPDWVLPYSGKAMSGIHGGNSGWEALTRAEQLGQTQRLDDFERVFYELPRCIARAGHYDGIKALTEVANKQSMPLADAFLADALTHTAHDEGDLDAIQESLRRLEKARTYLPNNGYVISLDLLANLVARSLTDVPEQKQRYLEAAQRSERELRRYPAYGLATYQRAIFFDAVDDLENLLVIEQSLTAHDTLSPYLIAAAKCRDKRTDTIVERRAWNEDSANPFILMARAWTIAFKHNSDEEIRDIYSWFKRKKVRRHKWWGEFEVVLLMQRDSDFRRERCEAELTSRRMAHELTDWDEALLNYIKSDRDDDGTRTQLLDAAGATLKRCRESQALMAFALKSLASGDRIRAKADLEARVKNGYYLDVTWARSLLYRLENHRNWPAWSAQSATDKSQG